MNKQVLNYLKAGCSGIFVVSHEETRVESDIFSTVAELSDWSLYVWSVTQGLVKVDLTTRCPVEEIGETQEPVAMLETVAKFPERTVVLLRDFHAFLKPQESNPMLVRKLRDTLASGKNRNVSIVSVGCTLNLPPEIEKEVVVIDFALPDRDMLRKVLDGIAASAELTIKPEDVESLIDAACGMTTTEAENAFALSVAEARALRPEIVQREKAATVRKNGLLEIVEGKTTLNDIGGLERLKLDIYAKRNLFTKQAREYGLPTPRGLLVVGQAGTGKSLTATATASIFRLPLLRLEAGKLFGSLVGESERNWRQAFATVKAVAPCILWIDEVDGLFAGSGSGSTDGGTTQRVLKAILQDMQMNSDGVFFMFTANDVDRLPDPLIDRLDVWSVDLPNETERTAIWSIHITKRGRDAKKLKIDTRRLAELSDGFSGRQIEQVWLKAMMIAFNDDGREPTHDDCANAIAGVTPTSKLMAEVIEARRKRLAGRAMPASEVETKPAPAPGKGRKLAA